jgi:hypothetical protein
MVRWQFRKWKESLAQHIGFCDQDLVSLKADTVTICCEVAIRLIRFLLAASSFRQRSLTFYGKTLGLFRIRSRLLKSRFKLDII